MSAPLLVSNETARRRDVDTAEEQRHRLRLKRESIIEVADTAAARLNLVIGCLELADDFGLEHHLRLAVEAMKATAKLTNDLIATKNGGSE